MTSTVLVWFGSRSNEGDDIAAILRGNLGGEAAIAADLDDSGALAGYVLTLSFPSAEAAFDGALAIRNFMAANGWPCEIE